MCERAKRDRFSSCGCRLSRCELPGGLRQSELSGVPATGGAPSHDVWCARPDRFDSRRVSSPGDLGTRRGFGGSSGSRIGELPARSPRRPHQSLRLPRARATSCRSGLHRRSECLSRSSAIALREDRLGPAVDVWGIGLRAWIDREELRDEEADARFELARELAPYIWGDERLSAAELR